MRKNLIITVLVFAPMCLVVEHSGANTIIRADAANVRNWCESEAYRNFSPKLLSSDNTQLSMHVDLSDQGYPACRIVRGVNTCAADEFYCEQAVWEAAPIRPSKEWAPAFSGAKFNLDFSQRNEKRFGHSYWDNLVAEKENLSQKGMRMVCMHLIPASIAAKLSEGTLDVDAPTNIVKIRIDKLNSPSLSRFRKDWIDFFINNSKLSFAAVNEKSQQMKTKYTNLFSE